METSTGYVFRVAAVNEVKSRPLLLNTPTANTRHVHQQLYATTGNTYLCMDGMCLRNGFGVNSRWYP